MKKKGFTLIELLGVIVVLAIILVISVPNILKIIESTRKQAFFSNVKSIVNTGLLQAETENSGQYPIYRFSNGQQEENDRYGELKVKGDAPYEGFVYYTNGIVEGVSSDKDDLYAVFYFVSTDRRYVAYGTAGSEFKLDNVIDNNGITYDSTNKTYKKGDVVLVTNQYVERIATFDEGVNLMTRMKKLAGNTNTGHWDVDENIKEFKFSTSGVPSSWKGVNGQINAPSSDNIASSTTSNIKIYMWFDNGTIYWWSEDKKPKLNKNAAFMFCYMSKLMNISGLHKFDTSDAEDIGSMFNGCSSLTNINLSNFNTSNVKIMGGLFSGCTSLNTINLSSFDTSKVEDMNSMFHGINVDNLDISNFDTSKVKNISYMFWESKVRILDLSNFNTSKVEDFSRMFWNMPNITTIYASDSFVIPQSSSTYQMFSGDYNLVGGEGSSYSTLGVVDGSMAHIDGGQNNPGYFTELDE